ncbi:MAG: patatin-like phospholipase family protein [Planctomycetes bacterium]|nr:patatin-like phospholipase family protein [Planctomycetota bacterium]
MNPTATTSTYRLLIRAASLLLCVVCAACSTPDRKPAVPNELADRAIVLNNPALRSWGERLNPAFMAELGRATKQEFDLRAMAGETGPLPTANYLAISGGGANGAYGAGVLCGWSATGKRPQFKLVTGISTGALTAPFAFLGPAYDAKLKLVYTTISTKDVATERGMLAAFYNDALLDTKPLAKVVDKYIDEAMLNDIAAEYAKGRILLVATTNLDAGRPVLWNIGALAASTDPKAHQLIRRVLMASAAIPAAFPPVMIDVEVDGKQYHEMHVDGGATAQLFLYPPSMNLKSSAETAGIFRERCAYVIRNSRLDPAWASTQRQTMSIAMRAVDSIIQTQGVGDLYRVYLSCSRDSVAFNLTYIPASFNEKPAESFDPKYMSKLFDVGYQAALSSDIWVHQPPDLAPVVENATSAAR